MTSTELGANKLVFTPESCQDYATFMFKVNDGRADSASAYIMTVDVVPGPNNAPVLDEPIPNQYARVGEAFTYTVAQEAFSDPDECDVLAYRALWDRYPETPWGGTLPAWLHFDRRTGTFSGTPAATDVDSLSVKVEASDGAAAVRDVFYLEVQPAARATAPLVSNLDQGWRLGSRTRGRPLKQRFTTGPNAGGYTLGSIDVGRYEGMRTDWTDDAKVRLSVCPVAPATGSCTALTPPSRTTRWADTMRFTVQGTMMLAPSTTYDLAVSGASGHWPWIGATQVGSLDADSLPGWRLASRSNRTTVRVALHGSANNPAAMPNSADADIVVTQGSSYTFAASDFPFTASSGGGAFWGVEVTSVPEKERSSTTQFKRGRLTFGGGDFYAPFTVTKAALDAGRLVYSAPADDAVGENYDWFRFRVRDAGHASMASYRMRIEVVASSPQQGAEPAVIDGTPQVSGAGTDAQWSEGETVGVTVTFSEAVDVDTTGGTPSIGIGLGGTAARSATYASGTGTTELVFQYTLASGDGSHGSMAVTPDSLALDGGTIRSAESGVDALLAHNGALTSGDSGRSTGPEVRFEDVPQSHDGETAFTVALQFSGMPTGLSAKRDAASIFEASGGSVTGARVTSKGERPVWEMTVAPDGVDEVTVRLPARACGEAHAVCIGGRALAEAVEAVVPGPPITAQFTQAPQAHDGSNTFELQFEFSHEPKKFSYRTVQGALFDVEGGRIEKARRLEKGRNLRWEMTVVPEGDGAVTLTARATTDCAAAHAACDAGGRKFAGGLALTVPGPETLAAVSEPATLSSVSVSAPAQTPVTEGAALDFTLTRNGDTAQALTVTVSVSETGSVLDGTPPATATFAAGSASAVLSVATVDDEAAEDASTVTVALSPGGGYTVDTGANTAQGVVESDDIEPITARFTQVPTEHDGSTAFLAQFEFSHEPQQFSYRTVRDALFEVGGGRIGKARRLTKGSNFGWEVTVVPSGNGAVTLTARATADCAAQRAVCDAAGRKFDGELAKTVRGPALLSVADATVEEAEGATLEFIVTMSRARTGTTTVEYATSDGTARAGEDYTAATGTLSFAPDETAKTVAVTVLDDAHGEGSETMTLTLSSPSGAKLDDATATGTIENTDPIPQAWIARFGRTVAEQAIEAVEARFEAPRAPGLSGTIGGQSISGSAGTGARSRGGAGCRSRRAAGPGDAVGLVWRRGRRRGRIGLRHAHARRSRGSGRHVCRVCRRDGGVGLGGLLGPGRG